jgi:hypothetical protein
VIVATALGGTADSRMVVCALDTSSGEIVDAHMRPRFSEPYDRGHEHERQQIVDNVRSNAGDWDERARGVAGLHEVCKDTTPTGGIHGPLLQLFESPR